MAGIQDFCYCLDCEQQTLELTWTKFTRHTLMCQECVACCTTYSCHLIRWWLRLRSHYLHSLSISNSFQNVIMAKNGSCSHIPLGILFAYIVIQRSTYLYDSEQSGAPEYRFSCRQAKTWEVSVVTSSFLLFPLPTSLPLCCIPIW